MNFLGTRGRKRLGCFIRGATDMLQRGALLIIRLHGTGNKIKRHPLQLDGLFRAGINHLLDTPTEFVRLRAGSIIAEAPKGWLLASIFIPSLIKTEMIMPKMAPVPGFSCRRRDRCRDRHSEQ